MIRPMCLLLLAFLVAMTGCKCEERACPVCDSPASACAEPSAPSAPVPNKLDAPEPSAFETPDLPSSAVVETPEAERDLEGQKEVFDFLKKQKTYYIATVENDQPRVRPFGTVELFEGNLYIQTGRKKKVSHQIEENGKIEICTFDGERWLRLAATAVADDRIEAQTHMLDAYPSLKKMYQPGDGNTVVYKLVNVTATFDTYGGGQRVIRF